MLPCGQFGLTGASARRLFGCSAVWCEGHWWVARWCLNGLISEVVRFVALRAIWVTGASARRLPARGSMAAVRIAGC